MIQYILDNKEWIFSGIGVMIIGFLLTRLLNNNKSSSSNGGDKEVQRVNNINTVTISTGHNPSANTKAEPKSNLTSKSSLAVLFIDDDLKFKVVDILKQSGFINTKRIKDIVDLDDADAKLAHVIFVDINGVGKKLFQDEGLGLAFALKQKYPDKKIILYSAESNGDRFHKAFRVIDDCLSKNAEPYEFINILETLISES